MEAYDNANLLKGGIVFADKVTTVSETYAEEIKTPFFGEGLDGLMYALSLIHILTKKMWHAQFLTVGFR